LSNVDKYRQGLEAFNARDWDRVGADYAADAEYVDRARDVTLKGREEIVDYLRAGWVGAFSDAQCTRVSVLDAGDAVIGQFVGVGTNDGPSARCPPPDSRCGCRSAGSRGSTRPARSSPASCTTTS